MDAAGFVTAVQGMTPDISPLYVITIAVLGVCFVAFALRKGKSMIN